MKYTSNIQNNLSLYRFLGSLIISISVLFITACASQRQSEKFVQAQIETAGLYDYIWQVEDIDNEGLIDRSHITMQVSEDGAIAGSTGCNQYFGSVLIGDSSFKLNNTGSTRKACIPALMQQEQRFLQALGSVRRFEIEANFLNLYDESDSIIIRLIQTDVKSVLKSISTPQDKVDKAKQQAHHFSCDNEVELEVRFVGAETLHVTIGSNKYTLHRDPAASGAKYINSEIVFWNKGAEALLEMKGQEYNCKEKI